MKAIGIDAISYVGTTLLSMILGSHPRCRSVGHCYLFFGEYGKNKKEDIEADNVCEICRLLDRPCRLNILKFLRDINPADAYELIYRSMLNDGEIIIDSSSVTKWFDQTKPDTIIYMFRHPVSLLSSYFKNLGRSQKTIDYMCDAYNKKYSKVDGLTIEYHNILSDTPELRNLFRELGLEFSPDYLNYWNYSNHMIGGSKSVLINIAKNLCPDKAENVIMKAANNIEQYINYYTDNFNGMIDIATEKDKAQVMKRCDKTYRYLQKHGSF